MTTVDRPVRRAGAAQPEEWWSILAALAAAGGAAAFLWEVPHFEPSSTLAWCVYDLGYANSWPPPGK